MAELGLQSRMLAYLRLAGGAGDKIHARGVNGYPDLLCYIPGSGIWLIEVKEHAKVRKLQKRIMGRLMKAGFNVACIRSADCCAYRIDVESGNLGKATDLKTWWKLL